MKAAIFICSVVCFNSLLWADDCDCTHFPVQPKSCVRICKDAVVQKASKQDLMEKIGVNESTASAVVNKRRGNPEGGMDELREKLPAAQSQDLAEKVDALSEKDTTRLAEKYRIVKIEANKPKDDLGTKKAGAKKPE
jgi:hypothetical protein